ncbi:UNKNOWN [Stylonychia lemnae]|uniref:BZIP domain-containing protein n=1 Tax=Stylonychia lemnae TaxID=5949 RepID=A0A078A4A1_STYLE|nr:UNKNOWN [Stylonychia lemnae]|eukprot:CDW76724.1 UNKNOWN [Stylonychia lemnae]
MNQKKNLGLLQDFEQLNWRDMYFKGHQEEFTYSQSELSPQFSFFKGFQPELGNQSFMNNPIVQSQPQQFNSNLLGLPNLMMIKKQEFNQQPCEAMMMMDSGNQNLQMKITLPFCPPQQQQEDAIMNIKDANQSQFNQQAYQGLISADQSQDIESKDDSSIKNYHENKNSCCSHNLLNKHQDNSSDQNYPSQMNQEQQMSLLQQFNLKDDLTYDNDNGSKKRRGRRKIEDEQYYAMTNDKIQEWEYILQNSKNLSKKDKKILRNRISAQKSRNKKKEEFGNLNTQIDVLRARYRQLFDILEENTCDACKENIVNCLQQGQTKRQKVDHNHGNQAHSGGSKNFMKMMLGFVAMIGVIALAANPFGTESVLSNSIQAYDTSNKFLGIESVLQPQDLKSFELSSLDEDFKMKLMIDDQNSILDVKKAIQMSRGIPIAHQKLFEGQQELTDSVLIKAVSNLKDIHILINSESIE